MKTYYYSIQLIPVLLFFVFVTSCKQEGNVQPTANAQTTNNSSKEEKFTNNIFQKGSNVSSATGTFNGTYNKETKILTYTITYSNITPTAMHFHKGKLGVNGPVEIAIAGPFASPITKSTSLLTDAQEQALLAGEWYVNIHTMDYPDGEIRAQLFPQVVRFNNIAISSDSSTAVGTFNGTYDKSTMKLTFSIVYSGVDATGMSFKKGGPGQVSTDELSVVAPFISPINQTTDELTAQQEADLLAGMWNLSISSNAHPNGEIRAQLIP